MKHHFTCLGNSDELSFLQSRALFYGENIFTSFMTYNGDFLFIGGHLDRIKSGIQFFYPDYTDVDNLLNKLLDDLIKINENQKKFLTEDNNETYYRITVLALGPQVNQRVENKIVLMVNYLSKKREVRSKKLKTVEQARPSTIIPSKVKLGSYAENFVHRQSALNHGYDDCLFYSPELELYEASTSNIFLQKDNQFFTPSLRPGVLSGVIRSNFIECLKKMNFQVYEKEVELSELKNFSHIFLTNAVELISEVIQIDESIVLSHDHSWTSLLTKKLTEANE